MFKIMNGFFVVKVMVFDREIEVKDVKENFTNLEKECQAVKQPMSLELQVSPF